MEPITAAMVQKIMLPEELYIITKNIVICIASLLPYLLSKEKEITKVGAGKQKHLTKYDFLPSM